MNMINQLNMSESALFSQYICMYRNLTLKWYCDNKQTKYIDAEFPPSMLLCPGVVQDLGVQVLANVHLSRPDYPLQ